MGSFVDQSNHPDRSPAALGERIGQGLCSDVLLVMDLIINPSLSPAQADPANRLLRLRPSARPEANRPLELPAVVVRITALAAETAR